MKEKGNTVYFDCFDDEIINLYTKKPYDLSKNISLEKKEKEYKELSKIYNYQFRIIKPVQKHTNIVKSVTKENINDDFNDCDGLITDLKGISLGTLTADCQAIFLYDPIKKVIGNIHSGWKGTLNRIIENAIKLMISDYNSNPKDIIVGICPSILKCCFEVDEDVKDMFIDDFKDIDTEGCIASGDNNKFYIDTVKINKQVLLNLGILEHNIHLSNICTKCYKDEFHSHRGALGNAGRNLALIVMKE